jgi:hypothetical protein
MAHGDAWEGKWRGNWRMEWVASTLYTTSEHDVSSITTADAHTSAASCRLNWRPCRFKWNRPFRRKTKSGFCACAITFQKQPTTSSSVGEVAKLRQADARCNYGLRRIPPLGVCWLWLWYILSNQTSEPFIILFRTAGSHCICRHIEGAVSALLCLRCSVECYCSTV